MQAFLSLLITYLLFTLMSTLSENMMSSALDKAKLSISDLKKGKEHCHRWIMFADPCLTCGQHEC